MQKTFVYQNCIEKVCATFRWNKMEKQIYVLHMYFDPKLNF